MKLYVGNLSYSVNDSVLKELFGAYGNVESARVISDRDSGQSKGFGFVEMSDADAQQAMSALNGKDQDGRALKVNEAKPQESPRAAAAASVAAAAAATDRSLDLTFRRRSGNAPAPFLSGGVSGRIALGARDAVPARPLRLVQRLVGAPEAGRESLLADRGNARRRSRWWPSTGVPSRPSTADSANENLQISARFRAPSTLAPDMTTTNSSPPTRHTRSEERTWPRSTSASRMQDAVAHGVAVDVVDGLEQVDVDDGDDDGLAGPPGPRDVALHRLLEVAAVVEARQRIAHGLLAELDVQALDLLDLCAASSAWMRRCSVTSCLIAMKWVIAPVSSRTGAIVCSSWYSVPSLRLFTIVPDHDSPRVTVFQRLA